MDSIKVKLLRRLDEDGASINVHCLDECFDGDFINPFCGLETEYLQRKYYKEHFGLLVSFWYTACHFCYILDHLYRQLHNTCHHLWQ